MYNAIYVEEWKELFAILYEKVAENTLEATTQLHIEPIEMERQDIPKQHQKNKPLPLHS